MIKLNVIGTLCAALAISSWSSCDHEKRGRGLGTYEQGNPVRYTNPVSESQIAKAKPLHFDKDNPNQSCLKMVLYADREEISNKIKCNPVVLDIYRRFMGCDPTADDIGNCLLAAHVFFMEADQLVVELGKKATHPAFDVKPDFRAFIAGKFALRYNVNLDAPVDQHALKRWDEFRKDLEQFIAVICSSSYVQTNN